MLMPRVGDSGFEEVFEVGGGGGFGVGVTREAGGGFGRLVDCIVFSEIDVARDPDKCDL